MKIKDQITSTINKIQYNWPHILAIIAIAFLCYGCIGTGTRINEIKSRAPKEIESRNWNIVRYEGYQWGSFSRHGGKVWYHVQNKDNLNIQYRVFITLWGGELHYHYGAPEQLIRAEIK